MLTPTSDIESRLGLSGTSPIWYIQITKTEGTTDPDSGTDEWPNPTGTGLGSTQRTFTSGTVSWTNRSLMINDYNLHEGRLNKKSIESLVEKLTGADRKPGGLAPVDSAKIKIDNVDGGVLGRVPDPAFDGVRFQGRRVRIYLTFADVTGGSSGLRIFTGLVNDVTPSGGSVVLEVESLRHTFETELPPNIFENETGPIGEVYPLSTIGNPIPLVFGAHDMAPGFLVADTKDTGAVDAGKVVRFADVSGSLAIDSISNFRYGDSGLTQGTGGFAEIDTAAGKSPYTVDAASAEVYLDNVQGEDLYLKATIRVTSWMVHSTYSEDVDAGNIVDGDVDTYASVTEVDAVSGTTHLWRFKMPRMSSSMTVEGLYGLFKVTTSGMITDGGPPARYIGWNVALCDDKDAFAFGASVANYGLGILYTNGTFNSIDPITETYQLSAYGGAVAGDFDSLADISDYFLSVGFNIIVANPSDGDASMSIYELALLAKGYIGLPDSGYYAEIDGYEDDGSGTYTGAANALVENPLHVLGFMSAEFNGAVDAFQVDVSGLKSEASSHRSGWKFARSLVKKKKWTEYAKGLCEEALAWSWIDADGNLTAKAWDAGAAADMVLDPSMIMKGELDGYGISRLEDVVTDFTMKYAYNPVRGEYDGILYCNASDSSAGLGATYESLCAWAAYDNGDYGSERTFEFDWIRDLATALEVMKAVVGYYTRRRNWVKLTGDLPILVLERGDRIDFDHTAGWANEYSLGLLEAHYRVTEKRVRPSTDTITIKAVEVL